MLPEQILLSLLAPGIPHGCRAPLPAPGQSRDNGAGGGHSFLLLLPLLLLLLGVIPEMKFLRFMERPGIGFISESLWEFQDFPQL